MLRVLPPTSYPGCQRLFQCGFRFLSSLYSVAARGFGLRPKTCRPSANTENSRRTREKPLVPIKPVLQQIRLLTGLNVVGKTRNTAFQLVLPQCCKTSCTFSFRLRAVSLFCSPSSKTRDTQMATRVRPRFARLLAVQFVARFTEVLDDTVDRIIHSPVNKFNGKYYLLDKDSSSGMVLSIYCTTKA